MEADGITLNGEQRKRAEDEEMYCSGTSRSRIVDLVLVYPHTRPHVVHAVTANGVRNGLPSHSTQHSHLRVGIQPRSKCEIEQLVVFLILLLFLVYKVPYFINMKILKADFFFRYFRTHISI